MLINLTNHSYQSWGKKQQEELKKAYHNVIDMPFPFIDPSWPNEEERIYNLVREYRNQILALKPDAVLLMGQWTFTIALVNELIKNGIKVVSTAINLNMQISYNKDGSIKRNASFEYVSLREYHYLKVD